MAKNKKKQNVTKLHPQKRFEDYVADATLAKFRGYIDNHLSTAVQSMAQRQAQQFQGILQRLIVLESFLMTKFPDLTKESIARDIVDLQDKYEGYTETPDSVALNDKLRVEMKTKKAEAAEDTWSATSRFLIFDAGSGSTFGKEIEGALIGMTVNESKTILFGQNHELECLVTINKISRRPKQPETVEKNVENNDAE